MTEAERKLEKLLLLVIKIVGMTLNGKEWKEVEAELRALGIEPPPFFES